MLAQLMVSIWLPISLPYLKRQNFWQSQWLLFATTKRCRVRSNSDRNKRYKARASVTYTLRNL